jgi:murein DD-endopeptidase MepM/ murein hydrolase activator NlpD
MRTFGFGVLLLAAGALAACESDDGGDAGSGGTTGGTAGGGNAGNGAVPSGGTASGNGGSTAGIGASGGTSGAGSSAGGSAAGGTSGSASTEGGAAGDVAADAGASGEGGSPSNGASGAAGSDSGAGGMGTSGEGGSPSHGASGAAGANEAGAGGTPTVTGLSWPVDCIPGQTCTGIGYPDVDEDGDAFDCGDPGYVGHEGTDIGITPEAQAEGTDVWAAADGVVLFAFDGKFDECPNDEEPDCQDSGSISPGATNGTTVCTPLGPYCGTGEDGCFWCFAGGNVIVIRHSGVPGVFATRYDHLKRNSVLVEPGDTVTRGQKIAEAASSGASTAPHLHFEVWGTGFYELTEPWAGTCGPNTGPSLWAFDPPWAELLP